MTWRRPNAYLLLILATGLVGCSDGSDPVGPAPRVVYKNLTERDNLLYNLELAYNERNLEEFLKLLDKTDGVYNFFFSATDVSEGLVDQSSWGYAAEAEATACLFDTTCVPSADKITLDLIYTEGEDAWQEIELTPGEKWYQKTFEYTLRVKVGGTDYNQNRTIVAMLSVRQKPGESIWQIVEWRDDIGN